MMTLFRIVFGLLLLASIGCFVAYIGTRQLAWRQRGIAILKWTLLAAFGFFAVLIAQKLL
mgnify:CR=1 FL=1